MFANQVVRKIDVLSEDLKSSRQMISKLYNGYEEWTKKTTEIQNDIAKIKPILGVNYNKVICNYYFYFIRMYLSLIFSDHENC